MTVSKPLCPAADIKSHLVCDSLSVHFDRTSNLYIHMYSWNVKLETLPASCG
jgi:hypothetical protein